MIGFGLGMLIGIGTGVAVAAVWLELIELGFTTVFRGIAILNKWGRRRTRLERRVLRFRRKLHKVLLGMEDAQRKLGEFQAAQRS